MDLFPSMITNRVDVNASIGKTKHHWNLSSIHYKNINEKINEYSALLKPFYEDEAVRIICTTIGDRCESIASLAKAVPYFTSIDYKGGTTYSIFDKRTCEMFLEYCFLSVFMQYKDLCEQDARDVVFTMKEQWREEEMYNMEDMDDTDLRVSVPIDVERDITLEGNQTQVKKKCADLLFAYVQIMKKHKDMVDKSYATIMDKVFKLSEREKDMVTDRLQKMTDDERKADTILKMNKLGVWNKGLQKGLTRYVKQNYDDERDFIENLHQVEKVVRTSNANVDDRNMDQYMEDFLEDQEREAEIDAEVYDIGDMTEDYMDGTYDPDDIDNGANINYDEYN